MLDKKLNFLYLIQTEDIIPNTYNWLKDKNKIVLSYIKKTNDTDIFYPNSTWTTGRNKLFELILKKESYLNNYDYFIFLDSDLNITLEKINNFENIINNFKENYPIILPNLWDYNTRISTFNIKYNRKALQNNLFKSLHTFERKIRCLMQKHELFMPEGSDPRFAIR